MFYSENLNLLFIASPKTGSTSVQSILLDLDPKGERFTITLGDRVIDSSYVNSDSLGHATASEFREVLGPERYDALRTIGFVRDPIEKLVSAYFFTRKGSIRDVLNIRTAKSKWPLVSKRIVAITLARLLPFTVWALVFPMKKCSDYFLDSQGNLIVDFLGSTSRLETDLAGILNDLKVQMDVQKIPHLNRSKHKKVEEYVAPEGILFKYLAKRYADDIRLSELVRNGYADLR